MSCTENPSSLLVVPHCASAQSLLPRRGIRENNDRTSATPMRRIQGARQLQRKVSE